MANKHDPITKIYIVYVKADLAMEEKEFEAILNEQYVVKEWKKTMPLQRGGYYDRK